MSFTDAAELFRTEDEKVELLERLSPYEKVAVPADAPEGSEIAALHGTVRHLTQRRVGHVDRVSELRAKQSKARQAMDAAVAKDDFAAIAARKVELAVLTETLQESEAAATATDDALAAAELELSNAWQLCTNARMVLRKLIEHGDDPPTFRYRSRGPHCWGYLRDYLDVAGRPAGVVARSSQAA